MCRYVRRRLGAASILRMSPHHANSHALRSAPQCRRGAVSPTNQERRSCRHDDAGTSASVMTPNSIVPGSLGTKGAPVTWMIDKSKRVVRFDLQKAIPNVDWASRYAPPVYELPLAPMLASIGTAPGDRIAMAGAGAKVLLPVNEPGALLVLGHGL